jgi:hypothetical protein
MCRFSSKILNKMDYLINKYKGNIDLKKATCECCGKEYETNINRLRCSKSCSNIMKHRRNKNNAVFRVKYDKETMVRTTIDIFGFVKRAVY